MQKIYKVRGGHGGTCSCGHRQRLGEDYYIVETGEHAYSVCNGCGRQQGLDAWWGRNESVTVEEMERMWFGGQQVREVVCTRLSSYTRKSNGRSRRREEMLENAVEV